MSKLEKLRAVYEAADAEAHEASAAASSCFARWSSEAAWYECYAYKVSRDARDAYKAELKKQEESNDV